jgi:hypothetical protein
MAQPFVGWLSSFGVGDESTWATPVTPTKFFRHAGFKPGEKWPKVDYPAFSGMSPMAHDRGLYQVMPEIIIPGVYTGMEYLLYHLFQKAPTITSPGTLARQQVYTFADATAPPAGLTGEAVYKRGSLGTPKAYTFAGMKVLGVTIDFNEDRTMTFTFRLAAKSMAVQGSPTTVTYPADTLPIYWSHIVAKKGGAAFAFRSGSIEIDNGLISDQRQMGSYFALEPARARKRAVTFKLSTDFENEATLRDLLAGTSAGTAPADAGLRLQITATHPNANAIESGQTYSWDLDMKDCYLDDYDLPMPDEGIVGCEVSGFSQLEAAGVNEIAILTTKNKVTAVP